MYLGIKYVLPGYVFMVIIPLMLYVSEDSEPQLHHCIEVISDVVPSYPKTRGLGCFRLPRKKS